MVSVLGAALFVLSSLSFWSLLPRDGKTHWLFAIPSIEAYLPVIVISGIVLGLMLIFAPLLS